MDSSFPPLPPEPDFVDPLGIQRSRRRLLKVVLSVIAIIICIIPGCVMWYRHQLTPVAGSTQSATEVTIDTGMMPDAIADRLEEKGVIRSAFAFLIYTKLHEVRNQLQAGTYQLAPSLSTPEVVERLTSGKTGANVLVVTFVPGATLYDNSDTPLERKQDIYHTLQKLGYNHDQIEAALHTAYDMPELFADKPAGTSLEGYIYGDTYHFDEGTAATAVIQRALSELQTVIEQNDLVAAYKAQGLTLYEGITMASIVEREVIGIKDQKQVAQVFFKRWREGKPLGSDVTAYYGAALEGKKIAVSTDTPYNTRMHQGLPPGPISSPGLSALLAVAHPAKGDYEYFLSGDDDKTYFAHTSEQHERNISEHCVRKCAVD